ncbi:MAG: DNA recombination protein RmuC [Candidatus Omnitrophica bacterium]|nr:DNA recombination protein RmuC [Candidatus Omnitrophota bacterium]
MAWLAGSLFLLFSLIIIGILLKIFSLLNERLSQMNQSLQEENRAVRERIGDATNIFGNVQASLGKLEKTNQQIVEISKDISSLQELLRAPKFRGQMGETLLENLLSQVLPKAYYQMQYRFKSGEAVDAALKLGERLVPIDAKFSLENFQKMLQAPDEQLKNTHRRKFIQDIKARVDEVASKYILPQENTYDFAFMYIPAENVYYEIIIKEDLLSYFVSKKVIPVSPNTFYAYLQIICLGLKGLKIEENAKVILKNLSTLSIEIGKFKDDFDTLGGHLSNARSKYEDSQKRLDRFSDRLTNMQDTREIEVK